MAHLPAGRPVDGQKGGNSGVYLQHRYEVQAALWLGGQEIGRATARVGFRHVPVLQLGVLPVPVGFRHVRMLRVRILQVGIPAGRVRIRQWR